MITNLKETIELMTSEDYKERFEGEGCREYLNAEPEYVIAMKTAGYYIEGSEDD